MHSELPHIIIPYKRHCAKTIEKVLAADSPHILDAPVEEGTIWKIRAWWKKLLPYLLHILNGLSVKHNITFEESAPPGKIVRAAANVGFYPHTRSAFSPG